MCHIERTAASKRLRAMKKLRMLLKCYATFVFNVNGHCPSSYPHIDIIEMFVIVLKSTESMSFAGINFGKSMVSHIVPYSLGFVNYHRSNALAPHQRKVRPNSWHSVLYSILYKVFHKTNTNNNWYRWPLPLPHPNCNQNHQNFKHIVS